MKNMTTHSHGLKTLLLLAVLAAGCGQSKVDYSHQGDGAAPSPGSQTVTAAPDEPVAPPIAIVPEPATRGVRLGAMVSVLDATLLGFQNWSDLPDRSATSLTSTEINGLGFRLARTTARATERSYTLRATERNRCVFQNRLLSVDTEAPFYISVRNHYPEIFKSTKLNCIIAPTSGAITPGVRLTVSPEPRQPNLLRVRWLGSTASKVVSVSGTQTVEFRMTSRLAVNEAFDGAAKDALNDSFDVLLSSYFSRGEASFCGLERDFYLAVTFTNAVPTAANLVVKTRLGSISSMQDAEARAIPLRSGHTDSLSPTVDTRSLAACHSQHQAWLACTRPSAQATANVGCDPRIVDALDLNFRDLLDTRYQGFASDRTFALTRSEGNGISSGSALLWFEIADVNAGTGGGNQPNPLTVEDFQELYDILSLR